MEKETWIDVELVPDPDAQEEMGGEANPVVTDADVAGSRLVITSQCAAVTVSGNVYGVIELSCTFHPAHAMRFTTATLLFSLTQPSGIRFLDVEPKLIRDSESVRYRLDHNGKLSLTLDTTSAIGDLGLGPSHEFTQYHCSVRGSGAETGRAQWTFIEEPNRKDGLPANQQLLLTTKQIGAISGHLQVSARVKREYNGKSLPNFRDLILRPQAIERRHGFQLNIPKPAAEVDCSQFKFVHW